MLINFNIKNTGSKEFFPAQFWVSGHDNIYFTRAKEDSQSNFLNF